MADQRSTRWPPWPAPRCGADARWLNPARVLAPWTVPSTGSSVIRAEAADRTTARALGIRTGAPVLVEERIILDQDNNPIEVTTSRYASDRYALEAAFTVAVSAETPTS